MFRSVDALVILSFINIHKAYRIEVITQVEKKKTLALVAASTE